ncbi:MAG: carboxypeptidase regulatory-like domain-containing protein, partial [Sphingobacteriales bacterium]
RQYAGTRVLKEVVVVAKSEVKKPSHLDYPALTGLSPVPDHVVAQEQLTGCNFLTQCLSTAVMGFTYEQGNFYLTRDYNAGNKSTPAAIYYNGLPVDASYLDNIDPKTVETVEVFLNDGLSSINKMSETKGVIVVTGKKQPKGEKISLAQLKEMMPQTNLITITPQGYARTMEFYVPKFSVPKTNVTYSDLRTTVYWNPKIITDTTGKASFDFFNADGKGLYRVVLEGIDSDGNIARYVYHYKVD